MMWLDNKIRKLQLEEVGTALKMIKILVVINTIYIMFQFFVERLSISTKY